MKVQILPSIILSLLTLNSCVNTQKAVYFNNVGDTEILSTIEDKEPVIEKKDLLSISVSSLSVESSQMFNAPNVTTTQITTSTGLVNQASGYLVDQDGYIQFPMIGDLKAAGITKKELRENIRKGLIERKLLLDPIVNIRYLNFKVTVLGEVNRATVVTVPNEKISLLEAIGLAGDLTIFGKRDNIMVIRTEEGKKIIKRINLNSGEIFKSSYYYLKPNDIVYVEPNKSRVAASGRTQQILPIIFSGLSLTVSLLWLLISRN